MARCGHGQNRSMTSESEVETGRHYQENVYVDLGAFKIAALSKPPSKTADLPEISFFKPFWRSSETMGASYPMFVIKKHQNTVINRIYNILH